ncbi:MAG: ABC transporter ATP-binding protein, partial [Phormidesmis sp. RL_2_1]|nr:ABC transporter ATP-binding protein [Phormidesmis sp. RL_2_1]
MSDDIAISLKDIAKVFKQYRRPVDRLKELLIPGKQQADEFWALRDITLEIPKGKTVGIIGRNGSGKSTLLQIIAGTLQPTIGHVSVNGRVSALLELGSGFNPEFTGRQNVFFNGRILGLSTEEIEARFDSIASFADIGEFINQPVKTYSSGMFVRLAFSVAINVDPEVLIVDEALSVGDAVFTSKCMRKIRNYQMTGGTLLFVSHDTSLVSKICNHLVWLDQGSMRESGSPFEVAKKYQAWTYKKIAEGFKTEEDKLQNNKTSDTHSAPSFVVASADSKLSGTRLLNQYTQAPYQFCNSSERFGSGKAEIIDFQMLDTEDSTITLLKPKEQLNIKTKVLFHQSLTEIIVGFCVYDRFRNVITGFNNAQWNYKMPHMKAQ